MYDLVTREFRTPHGHPITMTYREDTNDWNTLTSCLTEDEYGLPDDLTGYAFDIGGHIGSVGIALAIDNPLLTVVEIVEPVPPNQDLIERNIAANGLAGRVLLTRGAVGGFGERVSVAYGYADSEVGRHHAFIGNLSIVGDEAPGAVVEYDALDLATLVDVAGGWISWMKLDTEGAEYALLGSIAREDVGTIVGEWHPNGTKDDIRRLLEPTHHLTFTGDEPDIGGFRAVHR